MKKTKDIEELNNKVIEFESLEDAEKFEELAGGRKFCKVGERVQDICEDEVENYVCRTSGNLILRLYFKHKAKKNKLLLEKRTTSLTRAVAKGYIDREGEIDKDNLTKKTKEAILEQAREYKKKH